MTPAFIDANSSRVSSVMGSASMSARNASTGPGRPVRRRATTLVGVGLETSRPPISRSVRSTNAEVSFSWNESSGLACK